MPSIMVPEDPIASATQCYASSPRRAKPSPTKSTPRLELPVLAHPEPAAALSCVPTPGLGPPGTILLAPSRNSANDLDLPMIDQICRSSFQVQKALQRWQRDALAAHRLQWERQLRHRARCRAQVWRERTRVQQEQSMASPQAEEQGEVISVVSPSEESPTGARLAAPSASSGAGEALRPQGSPRATRRVTQRPDVARLAKIKKATPKAKPERLRGLLKRRQERRGERLILARQATQALNVEEREMLQQVFELNSHTKEDLLLGLEIQRAVVEAGLAGHDAQERRQVAWACRPPAAWQDEGISFEEFAGKVIPTCRQTLIQLRQEKMQKVLASVPREWTGRLPRSRLYEAARRVLPLDFPEIGDEVEDQPPALTELVTTDGESFSISVFASELQKFSEDWYRSQAQQRREIQQLWSLDQETFVASGADLPHLDMIFRRVAGFKGFLARDEAEVLFDELGVVPQSLMQKRKTLGFLNEQSKYDFPSFVKLVDKIRWLIVSQEDRQLHSTFMRMASEN
ncbi:unnamed protein product, partial [Durusdinium trenchii]